MTETPSTHPTPGRATLLAAIAVFLVTLAVFLPTLRFNFVALDDHPNVFANPYLNPVDEKTLPRFWSEDYFELYTPVTYSIWTAVALLPGSRLTKAIVVPAGGTTTLSPTYFHAAGILFHATSAVFVFLILAQCLGKRTRSPLFPALGALFWAVHPLQVEPVAWVTGNNNVFSGFFLLPALLLFLKRLEATGERARLGLLLGSCVLFSLALLAKPTAAVLPLVAAVIAACLYRATWRELLLPIGTWLLLAGALLFVTRNTTTPTTDISLPLWQRPFVIGDAIAFYLQKLVAPVALAVDYVRRPEWLRTQWWSYITWLVPALLGGVLVLWSRRTRSDLARYCVCGFLVLIVGALPMLGVVPYYFHRYSTVGDRYLYISLLGPALAIAALATLAPRPRQIAQACVAVGLVALGALNVNQAQVWRGTFPLFEHTARVSPRSMLAHNNLAAAYRDQRDLEAALREAKQAVAVTGPPSIVHAQTWVTLGDVYQDMGEMQAAEDAYRHGIAELPTEWETYRKLALMQWTLGKEKEARATVEAAVNAAPDRMRTMYDLGDALLAKGYAEVGETLLLQVAQSNDNLAPDANYTLGVVAARAGDLEGSLHFLGAAVRLRPDWREAQDALAQVKKRANR